MSDKEKAKQIVDRIFESGFNTNRTFYDMALNSAIEMAEWKEQQTIEKVCDWLENNASKYVYRVLDEYDMQYYAVINKKEMIDNLKSYLKKQA